MGMSLSALNCPVNPFDPDIDPEAYRRFQDTYYPYLGRPYWIEVLCVAETYGWQPMGTVLPEYCGRSAEGWTGSYTGNNGQIVTAEDANGIADALMRALDEAPYQEDKTLETIVLHNSEEIREYVCRMGYPLMYYVLMGNWTIRSKGLVVPKTRVPPAYFIKFGLTDIITLCRNGSFCIW
jgi:hypothetical protein